MDGIKFIKDENGHELFVQIDLSIHAELLKDFYDIPVIKDENGCELFAQIDLSIDEDLWEDFYDLLIIEQRKDEESIPFEQVINMLYISAQGFTL